MASIFILIEDENLENDLIHGIFTELSKAVDTAKTITVRDEFNELKIQERLLDVKFQYGQSTNVSPYGGIVAMFDKTGKPIADRHVVRTDDLGL